VEIVEYTEISFRDVKIPCKKLDGTFILFRASTDGGTVFYQELDGNGSFVGAPIPILVNGDNFNYANLIRAD